MVVRRRSWRLEFFIVKRRGIEVAFSVVVVVMVSVLELMWFGISLRLIEVEL